MEKPVHRHIMRSNEDLAFSLTLVFDPGDFLLGDVVWDAQVRRLPADASPTLTFGSGDGTLTTSEIDEDLRQITISFFQDDAAMAGLSGEYVGDLRMKVGGLTIDPLALSLRVDPGVTRG